jgi:hypothetical protein
MSTKPVTEEMWGVAAAPKAARAETWSEKLTRCYAEGYDDIEIMAELGLSRKDFANQYDQNPVFAELVDIGRIASAAWWRGIARKNLFSKEFNGPTWAFNMKNRAGWADKTENINTDVGKEQLSLNELNERIAAKLPGVNKFLGDPKLKERDLVDPETK